MKIKIKKSSQETLKMFQWLKDKNINYKIWDKNILEVDMNAILDRFMFQCECDVEDLNGWVFVVDIINNDEAMMFKLIWG